MRLAAACLRSRVLFLLSTILSLQMLKVEHSLVIDFRFKDHENTEERRWDIIGLFWAIA